MKNCWKERGYFWLDKVLNFVSNFYIFFFFRLIYIFSEGFSEISCHFQKQASFFAWWKRQSSVLGISDLKQFYNQSCSLKPRGRGCSSQRAVGRAVCPRHEQGVLPNPCSGSHQGEGQGGPCPSKEPCSNGVHLSATPLELSPAAVFTFWCFFFKKKSAGHKLGLHLAQRRGLSLLASWTAMINFFKSPNIQFCGASF